MTQFKKSFKGMAAALSMATLSMLGAGCDNDTRLPGEKTWDDYVQRVVSNPDQAMAAEIDDNDIGARSKEFNQIFEHSDFIRDCVQNDKKRSIRAATKEALALLRKQKKLSGGVAVLESEFLANYTPEKDSQMTRQEWLDFFQKAAKTSDLIRARGDDVKGVVPQTLGGGVCRTNGMGEWRAVSPLSSSAGVRLYGQHRYSSKQYSNLVKRYEKWER